MRRKILLAVGRNARWAWIGALLIASGACSPLDDVMAYWAGRHMRISRSFDPYENTIAPPENSVPFASGNNTPGPGRLNTGQPEMGLMPAPFAQADLFGPVVQNLPNPVPADQASLERGEVLFNRMCAVCHGPAGVGAQANIIEKYPLLIAYNLSGSVVAGYSDGYIYGIMRVGRGLMPPYAHQISHFDRWNIVNYIRVLQVQAGNPPVAAGAQ
jgi:mono/diheme cytochrome c family protein